MNKIYTILLLSLTLFVAGCSDDDDDKVVQNLKVIESQTEYPSLGGTGTIEVSSVGAFTATSSETWCKPSVSGNIITVTVGQNTDIEGRHARIEIASGDEKLYVAVTQLGTTFISNKSSLEFSLSGGKDKIVFSSEKPVTVDLKSNSSWLSYVMKDDTITFTATKAAAEKTAEIELTSGILKKTIKVTQSLGYEDLLGNWKLSGVDGSNISVNYNVTLTENVAGQSFFLTGMGPAPSVKYNLSYNTQRKSLIFSNLTYLGFYNFEGLGDNHVFACFYNPATGNLTPTTTVQYEGSITAGTTTLTYTFKDNGTWPNQVVRGFFNGMFAGQDLSGFTGYAWTILLDVKMEKQ